MSAATNAILDRHGRPVFACADCGEPVTTDDLFALGLRVPDDGESRDDYFAAELLDSLSHITCSGRAQPQPARR
jgi:hypothetical protein